MKELIQATKDLQSEISKLRQFLVLQEKARIYDVHALSCKARRYENAICDCCMVDESDISTQIRKMITNHD